MKKISLIIAFIIGYIILSNGNVNAKIILPFIIMVVIATGIGKRKLWNDGEKSKRFKKIIGLK